MSEFRREIYCKPTQCNISPETTGHEAFDFHASLPNYKPTPFIPLPALASELQVARAYIKDESSRLGLPSFKILGASWGACQAISRERGLPPTSGLAHLRAGLAANPLTLLAATDGNHGRAVAHIASLLGIPALIFVPESLETHVKDAISSEGAKVIEIAGNYDTAVRHAAQAVVYGESLLIQDTSWEGYEDIPRWIVQGYSTIFHEILDEDPSILSQDTIVVTPVGVGSLAHAVVISCKSINTAMKVVSVEPDTAACLYKNRLTSELTPIETSFTIMTGMDCGTVASTAYHDLQEYIDISLTISDYEAHLAVQFLKDQGISSGPCGAAGIAAARRLATTRQLNSDSTLILINTESSREYPVPKDVSTDDPIELTQILKRIESANTTLSKSPGSGEQKIADYIESWLQHRDIETFRAGSAARPSIIGRVRGSVGGKPLLLNGHVDSVSPEGYLTTPLTGTRTTQHGRDIISGRGVLDMKVGVAVRMCNLARAAISGMNSDVIRAAVADEEDASTGTKGILRAGWSAGAAMIPEQT